MDVVTINGAQIAFTHRPSLGRTVVFANSLGSDQSIWDEVIAALPRGYGVLTYDLPGHGLSNGRTSSIEGLADDLSQLIDALELRDVLFCGVSIGGMIGQVLAARRADVVRAAVLCNTAPVIGTAERWGERIAAIEADSLAGISETVINNWFGPDYYANTERVAMHRAMLSRTSDAGYIATSRAISEADLSTYAGTITMPVLCIGGTHDPTVPPSAVEGLAQSIPGGQLRIFDRLGHLPCLEIPTALAALIEELDPKLDLAEAGMATRSAVLGEAHVERASTQITDLDQGFQSLITQGAWGSVWNSPGISPRERSMLTLALLAATGNFEEIPMHIRATARTGASARDIAEAFQHVAIYAGVPRANNALKLAKQTLAEMAEGSDE